MDYFDPLLDTPLQRNDDFMAQKYFGPGGIVLISQVAAALPDMYRLLQEMDTIHALIEDLKTLRSLLSGTYVAPTLINGTNGKSAFELAQGAGFTGTLPQWLASLKAAPAVPTVNGTNGLNADYAIAGNAVTNILAGEILTDHTVVRPCKITGGFIGSSASCVNNPAAVFVLSVYKNNVLIGTISFSITGVSTLATVGNADVNLTINDVVTVIAPTTVDASISRVRYTIKGI